MGIIIPLISYRGKPFFYKFFGQLFFLNLIKNHTNFTFYVIFIAWYWWFVMCIMFYWFV